MGISRETNHWLETARRWKRRSSLGEWVETPISSEQLLGGIVVGRVAPICGNST